MQSKRQRLITAKTAGFQPPHYKIKQMTQAELKTLIDAARRKGMTSKQFIAQFEAGNFRFFRKKK